MGYKRKVLFIIICLGLILGGCSKAPNPEEAFETYISHWSQGDYDAMYQALSQNAKGTISQEEFVNRYKNIYEGIEVDKLSIEINKEEKFQEEDAQLKIPYTLKMETLAGPIEFSNEVIIIEEEGEDGKQWGIEWNESMIFPQMEKGDSVRVETIAAERGEIHDRNGIALANNGEIQMIGIVPQNLGDNPGAVKERLAQEFEMTIGDIDNKLNASWVQPNLFVPIGSLSSNESTKIQELTALPGVLTQKKAARVYPLKDTTAHLVGYIGSINKEELEEVKDKDYHQNSIIGKTGLEQLYEEQLRAIDGKAINIIKEDKSIKETIAKKEPVDGQDIELTIDTKLQRAIYREMKGDKGTAVAMHPVTGEVLAMVNSPSYDPNAFILGLSTKQWNNLNEDVEKPLLNRFALTYVPGSVFKPITAAIGLEKGVVDPDKAINIDGLQWQKDSSWGTYHVTRVKDAGKPVNLRDAFVYSDNIYFARAALDIGEKSFVEGAKEFAIGEQISFSYPIKASQIANNESLEGDIQLADSGYGQGQVSMSPLHLTSIYTTFLNEGSMVQPILNMEDKTEESKQWKEEVISKETAKLIKEDLIQVIEHPQGTGKAGKISGLTLGGKTGTAELKSSKDEDGQEYGWFTAFDTQDPKIIVTMMIEDVGEKGGSAYVVPKVKSILEDYLK